MKAIPVKSEAWLLRFILVFKKLFQELLFKGSV